MVARGKQWKSYCNSPCVSCSVNSMFFVKTANRYCYDDKYDITPVKKQMRYKKDGKTNIIATGVIGHATSISQNNDIQDETYTWEKNLVKVVPVRQDERMYILKQACIYLGYNYDELIKIIIKINSGKLMDIVKPKQNKKEKK